MYVAPLGGYRKTFTSIDEWIEFVASHQGYGLKPPASWLEAQEAKGRNVSAATAIWYRRYKQGDRLAIWMIASVDDLQRAGYQV